MQPFETVLQEVERAKRGFTASSIVYAADAMLKSCVNGVGDHSVTICSPVLQTNGSCTVAVVLEAQFGASGTVSDPSSCVTIVAEWVATFLPSYPTTPCLWHYVKDAYLRNVQREDGVEPTSRCGLRPFVIEEVVSKLSAMRLTHSTEYNDITSRDATALDRSHYSVPRVGVPRGGDSMNSPRNIYPDMFARRDYDRVTESSFSSGLNFLCSWWEALELDCDSLAFGRDRAFFGSTNTLDDDNSRWLPQDGCALRFEDFMGGGAVQCPRREFAAVFMPNGGVVAWGCWRRSEGRRESGQITFTAHLGDDSCTVNKCTEDQTTVVNPLETVLSSHARLSRSGAGVDDGDGDGGDPISIESEVWRSSRLGCRGYPLQLLFCSSKWLLGVPAASKEKALEKKRPLPSLLVPENVLHTRKYGFDDICLCAEDPSAALCRCSRIAREGRSLKKVSNMFRMLRHLMKGSLSSSTPALCAQKLLVPALDRVVMSLQNEKRYFWAGIAVCCVVLPSLLSNRLVFPDIVKQLINPMECYRCVEVVVYVLSTMGLPVKCHEAVLAKTAIEKAYHTSAAVRRWPLSDYSSSHGTLHAEPYGGSFLNTSKMMCLAAGLPAAAECSVCGLASSREVKKKISSSGGAGNAPDRGGTGNNGNDIDESVVLNRRDGCLILNCIYCGHGGHLAHIIAWWSIHGVLHCPKGCNCACVY
uniref:WGS project CAEQ00000000 data, annotated contig 113 n=1 Tax=Trypanosoma congolense (strain IL3000) TaxID=1068625 RepID=F9W422_TRYCI|nr:unnamed protein product [Trypanosoma congolense IL3000]